MNGRVGQIVFAVGILSLMTWFGTAEAMDQTFINNTKAKLYVKYRPTPLPPLPIDFYTETTCEVIQPNGGSLILVNPRPTGPVFHFYTDPSCNQVAEGVYGTWQVFTGGAARITIP